MTRLLGAIVYNWPLKLMAVALATLLYAGLVVTQNEQTKSVRVSIGPINQPAQTILIGNLGDVTEIRYFVSDQANVSVNSPNFSATVDLGNVQPSADAQSVPVVVVSADPRIRVQSVTPAFVSVRLERLEERSVAVVLVPGTVPDGLKVPNPPSSTVRTVTVRGAKSDVDRVASARATIPVDASGVDVERDFPLTPVDAAGERVLGVDLDPLTVPVAMQIVKDASTASVSIVPAIVGNLAPGYEIVRTTLSVPIVTISGDASDLANIATAQTVPVSIEGRTADLDMTVGFDLPDGVVAVSPVTVRVHVTVRPVAESRSFSVGIVPGGGRADRTYALSVGQAVVTLGGSPLQLDGLDGATLTLTANVAGLDVGVHEVQLVIEIQGLSVVAISPPTVTVTVGLPAGSPSPAPSGG